ncbi:MAG TPA: hypothetical protein VKV39_03740 [Candidatus Sulfotelmatobacter sp.]|nr:hypothetical protein [Candidatus Sulfotelmatobacter sp.]
MTDKWGRRLFTAGAVVLILLGLAHSLSLAEKMSPANETERQLLDLMSNYKFDLAGSSRSMDNLLRGFSICFIVGVVGLGLLDLAMCRERAELVKRLALVNTAWLAVLTAVSLRYFFVIPTTFLLAALILFFLAWLKLPTS